MVGEIGGWTGFLLGIRCFLKNSIPIKLYTYTYMYLHSSQIIKQQIICNCQKYQIRFFCSFLDLGLILENRFMNKKLNLVLSMIRKLLLAMALILVAWQVKICLVKILEKPTGTFQTFGSNMDNTSISISFCTNGFDSNVKVPEYIFMMDNEKQWKRVNKGSYTDRFVFKFKGNNDTESCLTYAIFGKQVKFGDRLYNFQRKPKTFLYLHETGFFHSEFKLMINYERLTTQNRMLINMEISKPIPSEDCTINTETYDLCFNNFLRQKMNESGCVLENFMPIENRYLELLKLLILKQKSTYFHT